MITNSGKQIIAQYLIGQTGSYASYMAIGCGSKPLSTSDSFGNYATKTSLDFEALRIPIISRGLVTENGITKVVLTAELPSTERYEITEIGIYPSKNNPIPNGSDSQIISLFSSAEPWKYHSPSTISDVPLRIETIVDNNNNINLADSAFFTNADNAIFNNSSNTERVTRNERPRFLNNTLFVAGNTSTLIGDSTNLVFDETSEHIHLFTTPMSLSKNSTDDEIKIAFSVVNRDGIGSSDIPNNVKILIQFADNDADNAQYANFAVNLSNGTSEGQWDFTNNRYVVVSKKLNDLYKTDNFVWENAYFIKIYVCINDNGANAEKFYVALDAMKFENISSFSNVYGLTAYTVMKTANGLPIIKSENSSSLIEFRYAVDVP